MNYPPQNNFTTRVRVIQKSPTFELQTQQHMSQTPDQPAYRLSDIEKEQYKNLTFEQLVETISKLMYPAHKLDNAKVYVPVKETEPMSDDTLQALIKAPWVHFVGDSMSILRFQTRCRKLGLTNSNE